MSLKKEIVAILEEMADLMEFDGQNRFKVNAFKNGANTLRRLDSDIEEMINNKSINDVKGIGKGLQQVIYEYYETGSAKEYEQLVAKIPEGIHEILRVRGIGAKKVKLLYEELGIDSLDKLEQSAREGSIQELKGFSENSAEKIISEIDRIKRASGFMLLSRALDRSKLLIEQISALESIEKVEVTGELRRKMEVVSKIEIICQISNKDKFLDEAAKHNKINELNQVNSSEVYKLQHDDYGDFTVYCSDAQNYSKKLLQTTGSYEFLKKMRDPEQFKFESEAEFFKYQKLSFVIPEMREESYFDLSGKLSEHTDLSLDDFKGFFHFHTTYSDGNNTLPEMLREIENTGFKYAVVCDHSKSAFYANGLKENRVIEQKDEISELNKTNNITIFHGIESDILKDGSLDYPEEILSQFDFIVASVHSNFNLDESEMTNRIIKAVENKYTDILAHPTGRLLLARDGYKVSIHKVIDACAANDVAIEINANPHRLDLDWRHLFYAREKGCKISINPDAHSTEGILDIEYGILMARKGGVQPEEVINCLPEKDFVNYINRKVTRTKK